ncbi:hypothetical protein FRC17_008305 [Serendipita sp. 399]|nr:hypothetical protein FRC17_008305 [Serendipita sp. 399]
MTNGRPYEIEEFKFQGFVVTVPDPEDGAAFNTTLPYSNVTSTAPGPAAITDRPNNLGNLRPSSVGFIVGAFVLISLLATICWCAVYRAKMRKGHKAPRQQPNPPLVRSVYSTKSPQPAQKNVSQPSSRSLRVPIPPSAIQQSYDPAIMLNANHAGPNHTLSSSPHADLGAVPLSATTFHTISHLTYMDTIATNSPSHPTYPPTAVANPTNQNALPQSNGGQILRVRSPSMWQHSSEVQD